MNPVAVVTVFFSFDISDPVWRAKLDPFNHSTFLEAEICSPPDAKFDVKVKPPYARPLPRRFQLGSRGCPFGPFGNMGRILRRISDPSIFSKWDLATGSG